MKKILYICATAMLLLLLGCEDTNEDLIKQRGVAVQAILTAPVNTFRNGDFVASTVTFDADLAKGETVEAAYVEVVYNDKSVKLTDIASFPYTYSSNGADVIKALGLNESDVNVGDVFTFYVITTNNGINTRSQAATKVNVIAFCPFAVGIDELIGKWGGSDGTNPSSIELAASSGADQLIVTGISEAMITGWWGETITERGTVLIQINNDGTLSIPRQYIYTTSYNGDLSRYEIVGSGFWNNCEAKPHLDIDYDIYYEGKATGIGVTYGKGTFAVSIDLK